MSRDGNVRRVKEFYAGFMRSSLDPLLAVLDGDAEWVNPDEAVEPGVRRGRAAVEAAFQALNESFEYSRLDITRLVEIGDDVVAVLDTEGHGKGSQATFRRTIAHRFTFRNGKLVRLEWFSEPRKALEAVGLRE